MIFESRMEFVDSYILVYRFDSYIPNVVQVVLARARLNGECLSREMLWELSDLVTKKLHKRLSEDEVAELYSRWKIFEPTDKDRVLAMALAEKEGLIPRDARMLYAAAQCGCDVLWTKSLDLWTRSLDHEGIMQGVKIRNPFLDDNLLSVLQEPSFPVIW